MTEVIVVGGDTMLGEILMGIGMVIGTAIELIENIKGRW